MANERYRLPLRAARALRAHAPSGGGKKEPNQSKMVHLDVNFSAGGDGEVDGRSGHARVDGDLVLRAHHRLRGECARSERERKRERERETKTRTHTAAHWQRDDEATRPTQIGTEKERLPDIKRPRSANTYDFVCSDFVGDVAVGGHTVSAEQNDVNLTKTRAISHQRSHQH